MEPDLADPSALQRPLEALEQIGQVAVAALTGAPDDDLGRLREATATGELLALYWPELLRIVSWRLASIKPDPADVEDIASAVIVHMVRKIGETTDFGGVPLFDVAAGDPGRPDLRSCPQLRLDLRSCSRSLPMCRRPLFG